jgi:hypothetical protein
MSRRPLRMRLPATRPGPGRRLRLRRPVPLRPGVRLPEEVKAGDCGAASPSWRVAPHHVFVARTAGHPADLADPLHRADPSPASAGSFREIHGFAGLPCLLLPGPAMIPLSSSQELDSLGWCLAAGTLAYPAYQDALAPVLWRQFRCSSVALWRVDGERGTRSLLCLGRYGAQGRRLPAGEVLSEAQLGPYFDVLHLRGAYACDDTLNDTTLDPTGRLYRRPDVPRAFLDALVAINGQALGVLSCRQDFGPRQWQTDEEATLKRVGARVALHLTRMILPGIAADCPRQDAGVDG